MKLFSTIILLAATADARRRKKNKTAEEGSGEGSGVAPVTGEDAATVVGVLVDGIVAAGKASGQRRDRILSNVEPSEQPVLKTGIWLLVILQGT